MEIQDFHHHRAGSVQEACTMLSRLGPGAQVLAGGTEVLVDLKQHTASARHLVSLAGIASLRDISCDEAGLHVGALATQGAIHRSAVVRSTYGALAEAAGTMAAVQVRNRGTIGGNFCSAVPSADLPPICLAGGAVVHLVGPGGERSVPADAFFVGPRRTVRAADEILVRVTIPPGAWAPSTGAAYHKFALRGASALAVVGVAAWVQLADGVIADCRIALGAVHPTPLVATDAARQVLGKAPDPEIFAAAGQVAASTCTPLSDLRASAAYRRELVQVLVPRALADACERGGRVR